MKKTRASNMELLRIFAMFMIVVYHIVCHCVNVQISRGGVFELPIFYKRLRILDFIMPFGPVGNAIFITISGYFMIKKGGNIDMSSLTKKLLTQLGAAAFFLTCGSNLLYHLNGDLFIRLVGITAFNTMSWFVGYYFIVVLIAFLFLNQFLAKLSKQNFTTLLLILFALIEFRWSGSILDGISSGFKTVFTGIFLYSLGGYIQLYNPFKAIRTLTFPFVILGTYGMIYISRFNDVQTSIGQYVKANSQNPFAQGIPGYENSSIIVIILAISLFELFRRIPLPNMKLVNFIAQGTFMVYLLHDNVFFYDIWSLKDWATLLYQRPIEFMFDLVKWGLATFTAGILAYMIYLLMGKIFHKYKGAFLYKPSRADSTMDD